MARDLERGRESPAAAGALLHLRPAISLLVAADDEGFLSFAADALRGRIDFATVTSLEALEERLDDVELRVLVLGEFRGQSLEPILRQATERGLRVILHAACRAPGAAAAFYRLPSIPAPRLLEQIVLSALDPKILHSAPTRSATVQGDAPLELLEKVQAARARISRQRDLVGLERAAVEAVQSLLGPSETHLYCRTALGLRAADDEAGASDATPSGLVGLVYRTREIQLEDLGPELRRVAIPCAIGSDVPRGVLSIESAERVDNASKDALALLASAIAERLSFLEDELALANTTQQRRAEAAVARPEIFRRQALVTYAEAREGRARPLAMARDGRPSTPFEQVWLLAIPVVLALAFAIFAEISDNVIGRAAIEFDDRVDLSRPYAAQVSKVLVAVGTTVQVGDPLLELDTRREAAEVERLTAQFNAQLTRYLRDPTDREAEGALIALRTDRSAAEAQVKDRSVRAPFSGTIGDVRVRQGQHVAEGDLLVSIFRGGARPRLIGFAPASAGPRLRAGQRARLRLDGFSGAFLDVTLGAVASNPVPPKEALLHLGSGANDAAVLSGPVVALSATLERDHFTDEGRDYPLTQGLEGTLYVETRSQRVIFAIVPWLKEVLK